MEVYSVTDIFENLYYVVDVTEFIQIENSFFKDDYFGYINKDNKFICCKAHRDKEQYVTFVTHHNKKFFNKIKYGRT